MMQQSPLPKTDLRRDLAFSRWLAHYPDNLNVDDACVGFQAGWAAALEAYGIRMALPATLAPGHTPRPRSGPGANRTAARLGSQE